jgi:hypothetical protein
MHAREVPYDSPFQKKEKQSPPKKQDKRNNRADMLWKAADALLRCRVEDGG